MQAESDKQRHSDHVEMRKAATGNPHDPVGVPASRFLRFMRERAEARGRLKIGTIFAHILPLVTNRKRSLSFGSHSAEREFPQHCPFIELLQESGSQDLRDLEGGANYGPRQVGFSLANCLCRGPHFFPGVGAEEFSAPAVNNPTLAKPRSPGPGPR